MAINYFGFWITILANTDCPLQSCFSRNRSFQHYCSSKYHISGNIVNIDGIEVSYFCSVCALFECNKTRICFNRQVTHFGMCGHILQYYTMWIIFMCIRVSACTYYKRFPLTIFPCVILCVLNSLFAKLQPYHLRHALKSGNKHLLNKNNYSLCFHLCSNNKLDNYKFICTDNKNTNLGHW